MGLKIQRECLERVEPIRGAEGAAVFSKKPVVKKRILVVDDEAKVTRLLQDYLERTGAYEVRGETEGLKAVAAAHAFRPDLVLLDIMMPDLPGDEVASRMKSDPALRSIPIVFLTAVASPDEVEARGGTIGGHPFLAKPVSLEQVQRCIEEQLRRSAEAPS